MGKTSGKPARGELFEVCCDGLDERGRGQAHVEHGSRRYAAVVRGALPGERVVARVEYTKKRIVHAHVASVLEPSAQRTVPRCSHAFRPAPQAGGAASCGGCALQSLGYDDQLAGKAAMVRSLIAAAGLDPGLVRDPIGVTDGPWYYRNKMELSFGYDDGGLSLGLHPPGRRFDVLDLSECYLQSPESSSLAPEIRDWAAAEGLAAMVRLFDGGWLRTLTIREGKRTGERMVELTTTGDDPVLTGSGERPAAEIAAGFAANLRDVANRLGVAVTSVYWTQHIARKGEKTRLVEQLLEGAPVLEEALHIEGQAPLRFEVHPRAFFQPNTLQAEVLYAHASKAATDCAVGAYAGHVLDLYCGTGTIGLCLAAHAERVTGIELQTDAVENARKNAALNGIENVAFHAGDVGKVLANLGLEAGSVDVVVVDPPRSGLMPAARAQITRLGPERVVYVSCGPAALARDLSAFAQFGYTTEYVQPIDMFPHTAHIENVALLIREPEDPAP